MLKVGELWYRKGSEKFYLSIAFGFAEVLPDRVTILAQLAERADEIDVARAEAAKRRAEERLAKPAPDLDYRAGPPRADEVARPAPGSRPRARVNLRRRSVTSAISSAGKSPQTSTIPRAHPEPRGARAEGALPRLRARVLLVVRQPAASAAGLHVRVRYVMPPPKDIPNFALFLFCGILPWTWFSASLLESSNVLICRRQPHQEGDVPGRDSADRDGAGESRALPAGAADPRGVSDLFRRAARALRAALVSGRRARAADADARLGADSVGADRSLPRHQGHSRQRHDAVVLRDADHLRVVQTRRRRSGRFSI